MKWVWTRSRSRVTVSPVKFDRHPNCKGLTMALSMLILRRSHVGAWRSLH